MSSIRSIREIPACILEAYQTSPIISIITTIMGLAVCALAILCLFDTTYSAYATLPTLSTRIPITAVNLTLGALILFCPCICLAKRRQGKCC